MNDTINILPGTLGGPAMVTWPLTCTASSKTFEHHAFFHTKAEYEALEIAVGCPSCGTRIDLPKPRSR